MLSIDVKDFVPIDKSSRISIILSPHIRTCSCEWLVRRRMAMVSFLGSPPGPDCDTTKVSNWMWPSLTWRCTPVHSMASVAHLKCERIPDFDDHLSRPKRLSKMQFPPLLPLLPSMALAHGKMLSLKVPSQVVAYISNQWYSKGNHPSRKA